MARKQVVALPYGTGRRKSAIARVWLKDGQGDITINGNDATGYGFGWSVLKKAAADGRSAASFGHNGAYKTAMWIDPPSDRVFILLRHQAGDTVTPDGKRIEAVFYRTAIEAFPAKAPSTVLRSALTEGESARHAT